MPTFHATIKDSERQMIEPITRQLVDKILSIIGAGKLFKDNIYINSDIHKASSMSNDKHQPNVSVDRCDVNMQYSMNPENAKWQNLQEKQVLASGITHRYKHEDVPIFRDARPDITVKEQSKTCVIRAEITLTVKDVDVAESFVTAILDRYHVGTLAEFTDIIYSYSLPLEIMILLYKLYKMRTFELETPFTFLEYLQTGSVYEISPAKNRANTDVELKILRNNQKILTELSFSDDKAQTNLHQRYPDSHTVSFTYTIQFSKPSSMTAFYPVVIDNQLIPEYARPASVSEIPDNSEAVYTDITLNKYIYNTYINSYPGILKRLPYYDDWNVPTDSPVKRFGYHEFFIGAITLDKNEEEVHETKIALLTDLGVDFTIHPIVADILKVQGQDSLNTHGLINISVYANDVLVDNEQLSLDEDLTLTIVSEVEYLRYHLVLSEAWSLGRLDSHYMPLLFYWANFFNMTIMRNIDLLIRMGEIVWVKGLVYVDKTTRLRLPDGDYIVLDGALESIELHGVDYTALEGYGEIIDNYLFTKKGYPILTGGSSNGIDYVFRIGQYSITARTN